MPCELNFPVDPWVKGQYNRPRDREGDLLTVIQPGPRLYSDVELIAATRNKGWSGSVFPSSDELYPESYWDQYYIKNGSDVLVSRYGEVAIWSSNKEGEGYRVLQQQWESQITADDFELTRREAEKAQRLGVSVEAAILEKLRQRQKYLAINLNTNSAYHLTHGQVWLHALVGLVHSPIYLDDVYWSQREQRYRFTCSQNLDHLDKDKSNNSVHNLHWTTSNQNKMMVDWSIEQKRQFFDDAREILQKEDRDSVLMTEVDYSNQ